VAEAGVPLRGRPIEAAPPPPHWGRAPADRAPGDALLLVLLVLRVEEEAEEAVEEEGALVLVVVAVVLVGVTLVTVVVGVAVVVAAVAMARGDSRPPCWGVGPRTLDHTTFDGGRQDNKGDRNSAPQWR